MKKKAKNFEGGNVLNLDVMREYLPIYKEAMVLTLRIGWIGIVLSIVIGLFGSMVLHYRIPVVRQIFMVYLEIFRNTPLLIQLFFIYFALPKVGLMFTAETCGIAGIALLGGAYMSESFRSGLDSVGYIQMESALSLGMTKPKAIRYVILPQAISLSVPGFVANVIFLLKETSVFSAIGLLDLMFAAKDLIGLYYKTVECLVLLVIFYVIILLPFSVAGSLLERRLRYAGFGD